MSKNASYVLFDRGSYYECQSVCGTYEFVPGTEEKIGEEEVDVLNKREKINRAKELAAARRVSANMAAAARASDDEEPPAARGVKRNHFSYYDEDDDDITPALPVGDAKVKKAVARKKKARDLDNQAQAKSSTSLGQIRKAEVDWDFEEGDASDDEEGAALSEEEVEDKAAAEDVEDSEDEDKMLTNYGESLSKMLQNQKRAQADEELQKYSDDDDDDDKKEDGASGAGPKRPSRPVLSQVPVTNQVQTEEKVKDDLLNLLRTKENVTIKMVLVELGVSARNSKFQLIKSLISELCDIITTTVDGEQVRYIKLKGN
ncbi:hypothetical protein GNI_163630 [Gregarina niphandrodes]|uniref:Transcription initiation factor IIF subunit alpha n=1 Tax=Gregarina niphandrodes TaxID=110365 RepID=A0A023AYW5_GRENI|nr:hypothetical protein GNI_163630 [Gregarina niphandrodes]EZG43648.1 hypothetical protein GNI_163630 [Gregarina niphandrodes]|eukprot:XP_011133122.1 hypothetical protein GNI_163630 [Gregarina niphandrodes]